MEIYSTEDVAFELNMSATNIVKRAKKIGIERFKQKGRRGYFYTEHQLELIRNIKKEKQIRYNSGLYESDKIKVIEYYLSNQNNTAKAICDALNVRFAVVEKAIFEYLEDRSIIVMSNFNQTKTF